MASRHFGLSRVLKQYVNTDIQHAGVSGQLRVFTPFLVSGQDHSGQTCKVLLDKRELTAEGLKVELDLDPQLLDMEQLDSALDALPSNPFSGN